MKKQLFLLTSILLLSITSCGEKKPSPSDENSNPSTGVPSSETTPTIEDSTSSEINSEVSSNISSNISSSDISTTPSTSDTPTFEAHKFIDVDSLYLLPGEEYYLAKMPYDNQKLTAEIKFTTDILNYLDVSSTGKLTAKDIEEEIIVSGSVFVTKGNLQQEIAVNIVDYYEYGSYFTSVDLGRLYKKNVLFLGDSITHNWNTRPHERPNPNVISDDPRTFTNLGTNYVAKLHAQCQFTSVVNAAWSGGTMAYLPSSATRYPYKSFPGAVEENIEAVEAADYIFVFYGTNDLSDQIKIGKLSDSVNYGSKENSSFLGGMNYGIDRIRQVNPNAHIIFMNLLTRTYAYSGNITLDDYNNAISEACEANMTKLVDVKSLFKEEEFYKYSDDGLHPNATGYDVITNFLLKGKNN